MATAVNETAHKEETKKPCGGVATSD
jgi:hypothetical protein